MKRIIIITVLLLGSFSSFAQVETSSELYKTLKTNDSIIFNASFNTCNLNELAELINDDFEFYHDKSGLMEGKDSFIENTKNGLCKSTTNIRRVLEEGTLEVFALNETNGKLYAAIQKGVHSFYENDQKGSTAKFTHLWVLKNDKWLLKRVLSYDHKQPSVEINKRDIIIATEILMKYAGEYIAPQTGRVTIMAKNNVLSLFNDKMNMKIFPKSETHFFTNDKPLTFQFIKGEEGKIIKMIVLENGKIVEEAKKIN